MRRVLLLAALCLILASAEKFTRVDEDSILFVGRHLQNSTGITFDWSGGHAKFNVTNTTFVDVALTSNAPFQVVVDGVPHPKPVFSNGGRMKVAAGLSRGQHSIVVFKRSEPSVPRSTESLFRGVYTDDHAELIAMKPSDRRLEFAGASITCGYGADGPVGCSGNGDMGKYENAYMSYGGVVSRAFNADNHWASWSGFGLVRQGKGPGLFRAIYNKTLALGSSKWDFSSWIPQAVIFNIGTNDQYANPPTSPAEFKNGYIELIRFVHAVYGPKTHIFNLCGPMIHGPICDMITEVSNTSTVHALILPALQKSEKGCDGHPNVAGHAMISKLLKPLIAEALGW